MAADQLLRFLAIITITIATSIPTLARAADGPVVVYGGTPTGLAAAMAAADHGEDVLVVEPYSRIGGLSTNGLSHADFRTFPGLTGVYLDFARRVDAHYRKQYGDDSPQVVASFGGTQGEPSVNLMIFEQMIAQRPRIKVIHNHVLQSVELADARTNTNENRLSSITKLVFADRVNKDAESITITPAICIDATYEGDLMAMAGVPYHFGRESRSTYDESLAPETGDDQVQGYNFRFTMTTDPANHVKPQAPPGYDRDLFVGILPILASGKIDRVFSYPSRCVIKAHIPGLPNQKFDMNDVSRGLVRLSLPGENRQWPDGDWETRAKIFAEHRLWNEGLVYFLQNDEAVPATFRTEALRWGWCQDEFVDNGHLPEQLYVREARRMIGMHVYVQGDTDAADNDVRSKWHADSVAMGDYGPNCHGTGRVGGRFGGEHTGEFYHRVAPYQIPYGVLVSDPKRAGAIDNLLVPGAVSSSHVGFCALRLEPIWMALGQAAGTAAHLAIANEVAVQAVPVPKLQSQLHDAGAATIYLSDLAAGDKGFALAQWWGSLGGFHGLADAPKVYGERGENIVGQYFQPYNDHAAGLDRAMDERTYNRWKPLAVKLGIDHQAIPRISPTVTRGDWLKSIRAASR
jgi:hypothetical protein